MVRIFVSFLFRRYPTENTSQTPTKGDPKMSRTGARLRRASSRNPGIQANESRLQHFFCMTEKVIFRLKISQFRIHAFYDSYHEGASSIFSLMKLQNESKPKHNSTNSQNPNFHVKDWLNKTGKSSDDTSKTRSPEIRKTRSTHLRRQQNFNTSSSKP